MLKRTFYLDQIKPFMHTNLIKIIVGIRRAGKSTLLKQIIELLKEEGVAENEIIYLNFEDYSIKQYKDDSLLYEYLVSKLNKNKKTYILLDEIQEVNNFEKVVNSLNATENVDIYITGSNSKILSGELATLLTGRYKRFDVFPFSFKEMREYHKDLDNKTLFRLYVSYGGFPVIQDFNLPVHKVSILRDLYDSVVIRDIISRYSIKNIDTFERYITYLLNTVSSEFSAKSITDYFKSHGRSIGKETLYDYIKYAKEALLIYSASRYDLKGKKLLSTNEKYFINDQGFRATKFDNQKDIEKILENIVFFELLRRGYDVKVGRINDKEVDFIATKDNIVNYYQVTYIMNTPKTREREFSSLLNIQDQFPKFVLSLDEFDFSNKGIIHKNIIDFLLE